MKTKVFSQEPKQQQINIQNIKDKPIEPSSSLNPNMLKIKIKKRN